METANILGGILWFALGFMAGVIEKIMSIGGGICTPPNWSMIRLFWLGARR